MNYNKTFEWFVKELNEKSANYVAKYYQLDYRFCNLECVPKGDVSLIEE